LYVKQSHSGLFYLSIALVADHLAVRLGFWLWFDLLLILRAANAAAKGKLFSVWRVIHSEGAVDSRARSDYIVGVFLVARVAEVPKAAAVEEGLVAAPLAFPVNGVSPVFVTGSLASTNLAAIADILFSSDVRFNLGAVSQSAEVGLVALEAVVKGRLEHGKALEIVVEGALNVS